MTLYPIVQRIPWGMVEKGAFYNLSVKSWALSVKRSKLLTLNLRNQLFVCSWPGLAGHSPIIPHQFLFSIPRLIKRVKHETFCKHIAKTKKDGAFALCHENIFTLGRFVMPDTKDLFLPTRGEWLLCPEGEFS